MTNVAIWDFALDRDELPHQLRHYEMAMAAMQRANVDPRATVSVTVRKSPYMGEIMSFEAEEPER